MKLILRKKYKVKWLDAQSFDKWHSPQELKDKEEAIIDAVYIYVGSIKDCYIFAAEFDGENYGNATIIPKGCIKKLTLIK